jgi:hypothetical protein
MVLDAYGALYVCIHAGSVVGAALLPHLLGIAMGTSEHTPGLIDAAREALIELQQLHAHHYPSCDGGCPAHHALCALEAAIAAHDARPSDAAALVERRINELQNWVGGIIDSLGELDLATRDASDNTETLIGLVDEARCLLFGEAAVNEGWALFNHSEDGTAAEIQRDDEAGAFATDDDAIRWVRFRAEAGSAMHAAALAMHERAMAEQNQPEDDEYDGRDDGQNTHHYDGVETSTQDGAA